MVGVVMPSWSELFMQSVDNYNKSMNFCNIFTAKLMSVKPITFKISDRETVGEDFLIFAKTIKKSINENDINENFILISATGGQLFYVIDRVGD